MTATATVASLHAYPVKSCRGIALERALLAATGIEHDREWMVLDAGGRFLTQRECPRLALIEPVLSANGLRLQAPGLADLELPCDEVGESFEVVVWKDRCRAFDAGAAAAVWLQRFLERPARLVRFDERYVRASDSAWTAGELAPNHFTDGFPLLVLGTASIADLCARVGRELPLNRFRPNVELAGLPPYAEDDIAELRADGIVLRLVKPCTRCIITTTDQQRGGRDGEEPLATLRGYRWNAALRGVAFGQNAILVEGMGRSLERGMELECIARRVP